MLNNNNNKILDSLEKLISLTEGVNDVNSVIIVGSNYNFSTKKTIDKDSDIDFIILNNNKHYSLKKKFNNLSYDISFINQNDLGALILGALNGSPFFGKIFSSINNDYNLIKDKNKEGIKFINIIKCINKFFIASSIPNYIISSTYLHNILANKKDLKKESIEERFFSFFKLAEHSFNYMSYLIYPFNTSGSYRGKIMSKNYPYFMDTINNISLVEEKKVLLILEKLCPVCEYEFHAVATRFIIHPSCRLD